MEYKLLRVVSDTIYLLQHPNYGEQLWYQGKIRKHKRCQVTNEDLYQKVGYIPRTNGYNRMDRISTEGMQRLLKLAIHERT